MQTHRNFPFQLIFLFWKINLNWNTCLFFHNVSKNVFEPICCDSNHLQFNFFSWIHILFHFQFRSWKPVWIGRIRINKLLYCLLRLGEKIISFCRTINCIFHWKKTIFGNHMDLFSSRSFFELKICLTMTLLSYLKMLVARWDIDLVSWLTLMRINCEHCWPISLHSAHCSLKLFSIDKNS